MIQLVAYKSNWPKQFEKEKHQLLKVGSEWISAIEHIGSTSIPNMPAKPVIDIMVGVADLALADTHLIEPIRSLGYDYISQYENVMPQRRYFQKVSVSGEHSHHIHLVTLNSVFWQEHILFRDFLRAHPEHADQYAVLKKELTIQFTDRNAYANAKSEFVKKIVQQAKQEFIEAEKPI